MIQTQWPGLGQTYQYPFGGGQIGGNTTSSAPFGIPSTDGVTPTWWNVGSQPGGYGGAGFCGFGGIGGILQSILALLQQILGSLLSGNGGSQGFGGGVPGSYGPQQRVADADFNSVGDPHLSETGTRKTANGTQTVDRHYDSMTSHDDLVNSRSIAGGYRVSTTVTQPGANGVTWNQSATVHANYGADAITMNKDGSLAITSNGDAIAIGKGQSVTLAGGETVTENQDGSVVVSAANANGGTISTTLRSNGNGVDVAAHAHEIAVGGDIVQHGHRDHD